MAVALERQTSAELAASHPGLEPAVTNGEHSQVLAGPDAVVNRVCAVLDDRGIPYERLPVDRAFHTAAMEPMLDAFGACEDRLHPRTDPLHQLARRPDP
ncbi:hypothetical protein SMICM17S_05608 [Streptomyces microflavus]